MSKLQQLIEAAKAATSPYADDWESKQALLKFDRAANPATILELCALLEKAEEALVAIKRPIQKQGLGNGYPEECDQMRAALAAIKQWKETK